MSCGNNNPLVLTFHHEGDDKSGNVSEMLQAKKGNSSKWSAIEKEIKKCILLCANCHVEIHNGKTYPMKSRLLDIKGIRKCSKCGYSNDEKLCSLDFHHLEKKEKDFRLSNKYYHYSGDRFSVPIETILLELEKCIVLCKNCHVLEHSCRERFESLKEKIYERSKNYRERNTIFNNSNIDVLIKMYKDGERYRDISKTIGCSRDSIIDKLNKLIKNDELKTRPRGMVKRKERETKYGKYSRAMINEYLSGKELKGIAKQFGCSQRTVTIAIDKARKLGEYIPKRHPRRDQK